MSVRTFCSSSTLAVALGVTVSLVSSGCGRGSGSPAQPSATPSAQSSVPSKLKPQEAALAEGAVVYARYCQLCHAKDATGYAADNAPSLISKTYLESASDEMIAGGIRMGRPSTAMAAYGKVRGGPLEEREIHALVTFLRSKGPANRAIPAAAFDGDLKHGAEVFEKNCQSCHGTPTTRGNAVHLHNPELLAGSSPSFLRYAVENGRPPTPMPPFAGKLSEQELTDVVSWLWSFKPPAPAPAVQNLTIPDNLPIVINPKGARPKFTLRENRFVAAEQVKKALEAKQRIVIIDARAASDWIQFHIPGAISGPYHDPNVLDKVPNDGTWVVAYCACPHHASGEVVDALRAKKFPNTAVLDEGILFWKDHGYPVVGEAIPKAGASTAASAGKPPAVTAPKPAAKP